jgi:hypothetical protein
MYGKYIFLASILTSFISANDCSTYYNPNRFYEAPWYLNEIIIENIEKKNLSLFGSKSEYEKLYFKQKKDIFISKYKKLNEYFYPIENGLFEYKIKNEKVDEFSISKIELYKYATSAIAEEINDNFEEFWSDWIEDNYEMQLYPEQTLFKYKNTYFSFAVYIYGVKGDGTTLESTRVKYYFKNYTKEVEVNIQCNKINE